MEEAIYAALKSGEAGPLVPEDYLLFRYRCEMRLSWADLTGEWPQPVWRTAQDRWYLSIEARAHKPAPAPQERPT